MPHSQNAVVDIHKLTDYLLNPNHKDGRHKARLFAASLNVNAEDAEELRHALLNAAASNEARYGKFDRYGQRYTVDFLFEWRGKSAIIRSGWIIEHGSDIPRLATAFPL